MDGRDRTASVLTQLARFAEGVGLPAEALRDVRVVEAFCARGLAGRASSTKGTYRSVLRAWAGLADGRRRRVGPGYAAASAPAPYPQHERVELVAVAAAQRPGWKRDAAQVMIAAGCGAGLSASELMGLHGLDITTDDDGRVVVAVSGRRARRVPVTPPYDTILATLADSAGDEVLFRPALRSRGYKNAVCNLCDDLACDPGAPRFSLGRARSSFICDLIAAGTDIDTVLQISGLVLAESLARYATHVPGAPASKATWRARGHHRRP